MGTCENCKLRKRIETLEKKLMTSEVIKTIFTPKMLLALCLGISIVIAALKGSTL